MRIVSVNISKEEAGRGLGAIKMTKLDKVVVLAGKNGAGKSRIISRVLSELSNRPGPGAVHRAKKADDFILADIVKSENLLISSQKNNNQTEIQAIEKYLEKKNIEHKTQSDIINYDKVVMANPAVHSNVLPVYFVPKTLVLQDSDNLSKTVMHDFAKKVDFVGIDNLHNGATSKIQVVQDKWFNCTHDSINVEEKTKIEAISDYEKLKDLIRLFLGVEIGRNESGQPTLFGLPIGRANLSDGQKVLLQFCLAIYSQSSKLKDMILILDEPENHLHPSVLIETINRISDQVTDGQIWIATHSVPLLAYLSHLDSASIYYVEDGKVEYGGKTPEKVLKGLLGDDEQIGKLRDFLGLPAQMATNKFAFECLLPPGVVMTGENDPQSNQVRDELAKLAGQDGTLNVLEFGAGQGRLLSNIVDIDNTKKEDLVNRLNYIAYDKYTDFETQCKSSIEKVYGSSENRYFSNHTTLINKYREESFDVVIMCNVLHEIHPSEWLNLFRKGGEVNRLLKSDGKLLLIEDNRLPTGEKAHKDGFLILDRRQLFHLFCVPSDTEDFITDSQRDGRLNAHLIPKQYLEKITSESRKKAIESLSQMAVEEIKKIREDDASYKNGELHGFWVQQFANAQLSLGEL